MVIPGPTNSSVFREYVREILPPTLCPGDVVILDNLSAHKDQEVKELVEAAGAELKFLPPYSPDLNPIEIMWSKIKEYLRSIKARTVEELITVIECGLSTVTTTNIEAWMTECGYIIM